MSMSSVRDPRDQLSRIDPDGNGDAGGSRIAANMMISCKGEGDQQSKINLTQDPGAQAQSTQRRTGDQQVCLRRCQS